MVFKKFMIVSIMSIVGIITALPAEAKIDLVKFGVRAGIQANSLKMLKDRNSDVFSTEENLGFQVGLMSRISLASFFIQPELVYSVSNFEVFGESQTASKVSARNFEVPVLLGFELPLIHFMAGPTLTLSNDTKNKRVSNYEDNLKSDFTKSIVGYQLGVGVKLWKLELDARYRGEFKAPKQIIRISGQESQSVKSRLNGWQLNLGYFF